MEDLKTMLDNKMPIAEIKDSIHRYIYSANSYPDKLSLTIVMLHLIQEGANMLQSVDTKDFISQIVEKINEIEKQTKSLSEQYHTHLNQNDTIIDALRNNDNAQVIEMQRQLHDKLSTYDGIIKTLVEERERFPLLDITKE
jgi:hypothetical protein